MQLRYGFKPMAACGKYSRRRWRCGVGYFLLLFMAVCLQRPNLNAAVIVDRIVAVVNNDIITLSELNLVLDPYVKKVQSMGYPPEKENATLYKIREDMLNQMIDSKLADQEIKRVKISVDEKEVDSAIERMKETRFFTDEELRAALSQQGMTIEEYRAKIKEQLLRARLVALEVKSKIVITEEDVKSFYEAHPEKYGGEQRYHLRNIIMQVPPAAGRSQQAEIMNRMQAVLERLNAGESFASLARSHSEAPAAAEGGDLGFFKLDTLSPQLQEAVKDLKAGDYTPILETDQGLQIFYIQEIETTKGKALKDVSSEIQEKLYNETVDQKYRTWLDELKKKSHIKIIK